MKRTKPVFQTALPQYVGLPRETEIREGRGQYLCSDEEGLNEEQQLVFDLVVKQGKSVFFTGPAGTGKSVLLRKIIRSLATKHLGESNRVGVTASTGLAAYNIGGTTLHRFAGIGLGQAPTTKLIRDVQKDKFKLRRWLDVRVLIVDEISMIDSILFDKLNTIARAVRGIALPFGGIQLVLSGDFFQLPPVRKGADDGSPKFCFESKTWSSAIQQAIGLTQIYRQRDPEFTRMLNQIREGRLSPDTIEKFRKLHRPLADNGAEATELFPLRQEADRANSKRLQNINGVAYSYCAKDGGIIKNPDTRKMLLSDCIASEFLTLKEGAQVMLIQNVDNTLVNGSQGRIIGFANIHSFLHNRWDYDDSHASIAPPGAFEKTMDECLPLYPVVRFAMQDGSTRVHFCQPVEWAVKRWVPDPWAVGGWVDEKLATRIQVPLLLAWALSIHKAQGQTLHRVKVDLDRVFETGQTYVALSRTRSMEGLQVLNFHPSKVTAHPKVKAFYESMSKRSGK
ncbi:mitochondrial DNA helicase [Apiospora hydei]|uniref:ATP-dependent DNA helicase PIF1 n=1 Tax=Apiospora hydei TaxID=1337664 RepID=A0ABR1X8H1_9PEZI